MRKMNFKTASKALLINTHLEGADLFKVHLEGTIFLGAQLSDANLKGSINLSLDQLSKVKTLYNAKLDEELEVTLREKYPALFEEPK